ncbi:hypothetical protein CUMW_108640 [Citrus unshiu]|nr:hypothetical protein CUMW_108640 [Citrus unshiu]
MEENKRKLPSLPPNYVTLVQLQERWMKQKEQQPQQRKQKVKEQQQRKQKGSEDDEQQEKSGVALASTEKRIELEAEGEGLKKNARTGAGRSGGRHVQRMRGAIGGGGETHAPEASVATEDVVVADPTVEMEGKFQDMSIDGGSNKSARPQSNKGGIFHRGKYTNHLRDRGGREAKNARGMMVWVKKGDSVGGAGAPADA